MPLDIQQAICIALIQGITEFLPISSSAHLQLPPLLLGWNDQGIYLDVATHAGSLVAVVVYYRVRLFTLASASLEAIKTRQTSEDFNLLLKLIVATLPAIVVGFLAFDWFETEARRLNLITVNTIVFALFLWFADRHSRKRTAESGNLETLTFPIALLIGLAQTIALMPGVSRAGITMTAALLLGLSRTHAATFSFLLSIPIIVAAFSLTSYQLFQAPDVEFNVIQMVVGFSVAAVSAYLCIDIFLRVIEKIGMLPFVIYRIVLGIFLGVLLWL